METGNDNSGRNGPRSSRKDQDANSTDRATQFWEKYAEVAIKHDEKFFTTNRDNISAFMVVAGLFSAVSATFLVAIQPDLKPDPTDTTNALLMMLVHSVDNTTFADTDLAIPLWNGPSATTVWTQALGYAALSASLLAALGAVLATQWLKDFTQLQSGSLEDTLRIRQMKVDSLNKWRFDILLWSVPALIQVSLLLFSIALAIYMWGLHHAIGSVVIATTAVGVLFYIFATLASLIFPACPFRTPISYTIHGAMGHIMKSIEDVAEYWAYRTGLRASHRPPMLSLGNRMVAYTIAILFSPLFAIASAIFLTIFVFSRALVDLTARVRGHAALPGPNLDTYGSGFQFKSLRLRIHRFFRSLCDSARHARHSVQSRDPILGSSDPHAISWLLETSTNPEDLIVAATLIPDVKWPEDLDMSLPIERFYKFFIRSIARRGDTPDNHNRAIRLGKILITMLTHVSNGVRRAVWLNTLRRVQDESKNLKPEVDSDLLFILSIIAKLLSYKLHMDVTDVGVKLPVTCEVSKPLLSWLLQPLEILLSLEDRFLPEAYRTFLKLDRPEELNKKEAAQYWRTFEVYFNSVVGVSAEVIHIADEDDQEDQLQCGTGYLMRVLETLKLVDISLVPEIHQHLFIPLKVLSRLTSIPNLQQTFKDTDINHWMIQAFKEAVRRADKKGETIWIFASCLMNMAAVIDAFSPIEVQRSTGESSGRLAQNLSPYIDSKTLISYLLGAEALDSAAKSSEQTVYALSIVHANMHELPELVSDPDFIRCILSATSQNQDHSVRDIGVKLLTAASKYILYQYDTQRLASLATQSDLASILRHTFRHEDPPTTLNDLLHNDNEEFNANLLGILVPGDPLDALLKKLHEQPNNFPEDDIHDLEIALLLSNNEVRKQLLFDHLDVSIARMPHQDYKDTLALPLTAIIGRLLRTDGPLSSSEDIWKAFLRPQFEELLYPAWVDLDRLEGNPKMLGLLMNCTERWLSIHRTSEVASLLPESTSSLTLSRLAYALEQLGSESRALPSDIKGVVQRLSTRVHELV